MEEGRDFAVVEPPYGQFDAREISGAEAME
jgi:hypothetical protein